MPRNAGPRKTAHGVGGCREHVAPIRGAREDARKRRDGSAPRARVEPCQCPYWRQPPTSPRAGAARRCAASFSYIRLCHMRMADTLECLRDLFKEVVRGRPAPSRNIARLEAGARVADGRWLRAAWRRVERDYRSLARSDM